MPRTRRQVSLYLPEPARSIVGTARARADPIQHELIPAHVTLCRDDEATDWAVVEHRLGELACVSVTLEFGPACLFDGGGLRLPVASPTMEFDDLRARLLAGPGTLPHPLTPHITLRHPRNVASLAARGESPAWPRDPAEPEPRPPRARREEGEYRKYVTHRGRRPAPPKPGGIGGRLPRDVHHGLLGRHVDADAASFSYAVPIHFTKASLIEQVDDGPWHVIRVYPS